jgi:hypothetical protein
MHENMVFDSELKDTYLYTPFGQDTWEGSIQHALKSPRIFQTWRDVEKDCIPRIVTHFSRGIQIQ